MKKSLELHRLIYLKISFEKFSVRGNLLTPASNAAFISEIIVLKPCEKALHILYGIFTIHNIPGRVI